MKNRHYPYMVLTGFFLLAPLQTTKAQDFTGKVTDQMNNPLADVYVTVEGHPAIKVADDGIFQLDSLERGTRITIWKYGCYSQIFHYNPAVSSRTFSLVKEDLSRYNESAVLPFRSDDAVTMAGVQNINRKDFYHGSMNIDRALQGEIAGLQVVQKSGMPGEGSYLSIRGIHTLLAESSPLIVINGVPYMPDSEESAAIGGYSQSLLRAFNNLDIKNITVLKGAEAAVYGSLAGNGVIMIETENAAFDNMDMRISFSAMYGRSWNNNRIPLMDAGSYKSYLTDAGLSYYDNMEDFFHDFSFLSDMNANKSHLYKYNTDYQDLLYRGANSMDYLFRVQGGDAIAKYNISLGYSNEEGTLKNTRSDRYNAQLNADVLVSKKFEINAMVNMAYMTGNYLEQGLCMETNPMLAAYRRSPLLSVYKSDISGNLINDYADYYNGAVTNMDFAVSNPLSIIDKMEGEDKQYNMNSQILAIWKPVPNLTLNGIVGFHFNYDQTQIFIPGINDSDIVPGQDRYGSLDNTVRKNTAHTYNYYFGLNANWRIRPSRTSLLNLQAGTQWIVNSYETDLSVGRNTTNDFYQTLDGAQNLGRYFGGRNQKWNWMNYFLHADYTWDNMIRFDGNISMDGASSSGTDAARMYLYPSGKITLLGKRFLEEMWWADKLNVYADYTLTGNSRYSSRFGRYYYEMSRYAELEGIVRANVPNTELVPERNVTFNAGVEAAFLNRRISLQAGYFHNRNTDVLMNKSTSAVFEIGDCYINGAEIENKGWELSFQLTPLLTRNWNWTFGLTATVLQSKMKSLGGDESFVTDLSDDAQLITQVGESPYAFYGWKTEGVFTTTEEALEADLRNRNGINYQAGDVHYVDMNNDHIIDDKDKVVLGSSTPEFYGSFFNRLSYKNWSVDFTFAYSKGNEAYNAVRRITMSEKDLSNQNTAVRRRWSMEGQQTDVPRVVYGDKIGNNAFSDRWIEDAGYIRLRNLTLAYRIDRPLWNFVRGGTVYVTAENLFTFSDYLGLSPEFSYSNSTALQGIDYAKVAMPASVKIGIDLNF